MMSQEAMRMRPHYSVPDVNKPYAVSGLLTLLPPSTSILSNYIHDTTPSKEEDRCVDKFNYVEA